MHEDTDDLNDSLRFPKEVGFSKDIMRQGDPKYIEVGDGVIVLKVAVGLSGRTSWALPGTYKVTKITEHYVETLRTAESDPDTPYTFIRPDSLIFDR